MKKSAIKYIAAAMMAVTALGSAAQNTYSGYFVDGYNYRFRMNPAIGNDSTTFISIPGLANVNIGMHGNLHMRDVLYNIDGRTVLFTNPSVSASEVMGNLSDRNRLGLEANITVLAFGFKAWGGYNTFSVNARANVDMQLPKSVFSLIKEGIANETYSIEDLRANANAFAEVALGHSRDINKKWRVGGALKVLIGAGNVDAQLKNSRLTLGTDSWTVVSDAEIHSSIKGLEYKMKNGDNGQYVNGAKIDGPGVNGLGFGVDLGAVFSPTKDWQFSAAILDLGFINWKNDMLATTHGPKTFETDRYSFNVDDKAENSFKNEWENMRDDLEDLYHLDNAGDQGSRTTALASTLNFAASYSLPVYRKLSFGLVNTTRLAGKYTATTFRLSANIAPVKVLSASVNMAMGTYGAGLGWLLNIHTPGVGLFVGMDHTLGKLAKQGVPLSSNGSLNLGLNIQF